jgi:hypothetical protein
LICEEINSRNLKPTFYIETKSKRQLLVAGRCAVSGERIRRPPQQRPAEQRHGLHLAEGHAGGAAAGNPRGARPEVGGGAKAAANSSAAGRVIRFGSTVRESRGQNRRGRTVTARSGGLFSDGASSGRQLPHWDFRPVSPYSRRRRSVHGRDLLARVDHQQL